MFVKYEIKVFTFQQWERVEWGLGTDVGLRHVLLLALYFCHHSQVVQQLLNKILFWFGLSISHVPLPRLSHGRTKHPLLAGLRFSWLVPLWWQACLVLTPQVTSRLSSGFSAGGGFMYCCFHFLWLLLKRVSQVSAFTLPLADNPEKSP